MQWNLLFLLNSVLFGIGLAMDAFSVSMANGLHEPEMKTGRMCLIAGTFGLFQILMPLLGLYSHDRRDVCELPAADSLDRVDPAGVYRRQDAAGRIAE